jgi:hypothetical protein
MQPSLSGHIVDAQQPQLVPKMISLTNLFKDLEAGQGLVLWPFLSMLLSPFQLLFLLLYLLIFRLIFLMLFL